MGRQWQLQEAKNRFSELVDEACKTGPQTVTRHGTVAVVIISAKDYKKFTKRTTSLLEFFRKSPLRGVDLDLKRDKSLPRDITL